MNILVALNENYVPPLKVMLKSLFENHIGKDFSIYLMHSHISEKKLADLQQFVNQEGHRLVTILVDPSLFQGATVFRHFTMEMYYRLVAHQFLPNDLDRILYLDPDILVINSMIDFYWMPFDQCYFVAAEHEPSAKVVRRLNRIRLGTPKAKGYYNTGVLLMNLELLRKKANLERIFSFMKKHKRKLLLPDQDVLNALYWDKIKPADCFRYNYDARYCHYPDLNLLVPKKMKDLQWIKENTVFIHFCGKRKPWLHSYKGKLGLFYREYANMLS